MKVAPLPLPPTPPISASPSTSLPPKSSPSVSLPPPSPIHSPTTTTTTTFSTPTISAAFLREKVLYLESLGLDRFALAAAHPPAFGILRSLGFSTADFCRILSMCPDLLSPSLSAASLLPSLTFLLREAGVDARFFLRAVFPRPRLRRRPPPPPRPLLPPVPRRRRRRPPLQPPLLLRRREVPPPYRLLREDRLPPPRRRLHVPEVPPAVLLQHWGHLRAQIRLLRGGNGHVFEGVEGVPAVLLLQFGQPD